jgi:hypothetical protein
VATTIATGAGWFDGLGYGTAKLAGVIDAVTDLRNWFIHPGAFVREGAVLPTESMAGSFLLILRERGIGPRRRDERAPKTAGVSGRCTHPWNTEG